MRAIEHNGLRADAALLSAARAGDAGGVRAALACGADVNAEDASGRPAFLCALAGEGCVYVYSASNASGSAY